VQNAFPHASSHSGARSASVGPSVRDPDESTENDARGRTDRRASFDLTEVSDNLAEARDPLDKRDAT
jgi:hypothetical protein